MLSSRILSRLLLAVLAVLLGAAPASPEDKRKTPELKKWIDGPIRYLTTKQETQAFRGLDRDQDRILFIERFWAARDPYPETLTNEYRQLFWDRVREANELFLDGPFDGWRTDRGKIHILYGPPSEIQEDVDYRADDTTSIGGVIRWIYDGRAGGRTDVDPITVVPFVRGPGGEYRVSYDPELASVFWNPRPLEARGENPVERWMDVVGMPGPSEMSVMLDLGKLQEVPPQAQVLLERVETREAYVTHDLVTQVNRYDHPEHDDEWLVSLTVDVSRTAGRSTPAVIGRVRSLDPLADTSRDLRILDEASFKVRGDDHARYAQARIRLQPGDYEFTVMAADADTAETGLQRREVRLPERGPRMRLSDVVQASELESLRYAGLTSYDEPFTVGPYRVVPRFGSGYLRGESVRLFFEVYGARMPVEVAYQVQGRDLDGSWVDLGTPSRIVGEHRSQAWELPTTERWPLGEYRVRVDVQDAEGKLVSREVEFELVAERAATAQVSSTSGPASVERSR